MAIICGALPPKRDSNTGRRAPFRIMPPAQYSCLHSGSATILVTGGAGFIGSALIRHLIRDTAHRVVNVDKLTYAGNLQSLADVASNPRYAFEQLDICDEAEMRRVFCLYRPAAVMHLAAESHVDRSIEGPAAFMATNIMGTYVMLEAAREHWLSLDADAARDFRFHHVSTDEVYGDLSLSDLPFTETTPYAPSSPYSASKAASDHLVRAWHRTYGLPVVLTNCSNNYGPYHYPEKLIPLAIARALQGLPIPVYGRGEQIRDWLYVDDHARALYQVVSGGAIGNTYNIGGHNEKRNIDVIRMLCDLLEEMAPQKPDGVAKYRDLITHVTDRPGHDYRYAIDASKIQGRLSWTPRETFESGLRKTVEWFLAHREWLSAASVEPA